MDLALIGNDKGRYARGRQYLSSYFRNIRGNGDSAKTIYLDRRLQKLAEASLDEGPLLNFICLVIAGPSGSSGEIMATEVQVKDTV